MRTIRIASIRGFTGIATAATRHPPSASAASGVYIFGRGNVNGTSWDWAGHEAAGVSYDDYSETQQDPAKNGRKVPQFCNSAASR
jgi:hypothetical protein